MYVFSNTNTFNRTHIFSQFSRALYERTALNIFTKCHCGHIQFISYANVYAFIPLWQTAQWLPSPPSRNNTYFPHIGKRIEDFIAPLLLVSAFSSGVPFSVFLWSAGVRMDAKQGVREEHARQGEINHTWHQRNCCGECLYLFIHATDAKSTRVTR